MNILADASLPDLKQAFPAPFELSYYQNSDEIAVKLQGIDILICRSTLKISDCFFPPNQLRFVATASSGSDPIDKDYLQRSGIELMDAKGCNAQAVADYVMSCVAWLNNKKLIKGNLAGIIGAGKVGSQVKERLQAAQFTTFSCDPVKALNEESYFSCTQDDLLQCQLICVHAELHDNLPFPSRNLLDSTFLSRLAPKTIIINAARGSIVNEEALLKEQLVYCTDVYDHEPSIDQRIINYATLCTPHIAGHSIEAKQYAIEILSKKLHQAYSLTPPQFTRPSMQNHAFTERWQDNLLSLYDPSTETQTLKQAVDVKKQFLLTRKAHQQRHNFDLYGAKILDEQLQKLLGFIR